jgi:hypothetical protein
MGFTPAQVDACSLWEFLAARDGWIKANTVDDKTRAPTPEEHDALVEKYGGLN